MDAIYKALSFCGTDTRDEGCVLGEVALSYMRMMPSFEPVEAVACHPFVYIGRHKTTRMYTYALQYRPRHTYGLQGQPSSYGNDFICGVGNRAARGVIDRAARVIVGRSLADFL